MSEMPHDLNLTNITDRENPQIFWISPKNRGKSTHGDTVCSVRLSCKQSHFISHLAPQVFGRQHRLRIWLIHHVEVLPLLDLR